MASTTKFSRQRESIKDFLFHTNEHPTADAIYMHIRKTYPNISLGTVYRNLNLLLSQGEIIKVNCGDGCDHFDGNINPHNHFICDICHQVSDLDMDSIDHINVIAASKFPGVIHGHTTYFHGICESCSKQNQE